LFTQSHLAASLKCLGITDIGDIFEQLSEQYLSPTRHYHSDKHVTECLGHFASVRDAAERPAEIEVAFWFHDAIYDSQQSDNEELSAKWASDYLTSKAVETAVVDRIYAMIIATKTHLPFNSDSEILLDIDLGILGASESAFDAYDQAVCREYSWVAADVYEVARKQVLESFLARERIYHTERMFEQYEAQARANLTRRINA